MYCCPSRTLCSWFRWFRPRQYEIVQELDIVVKEAGKPTPEVSETHEEMTIEALYNSLPNASPISDYYFGIGI